MVVFKSAFGEVEFLEQESIVILKIVNYALAHEAKENLNHLYAVIKEKNLTDCIFDLSEWEGGLAEGIEEWLYTDYIPKMILAGVEATAIIAAKDPFSFIATEYIAEDVNNIVNVRFLENREFAQIWLLNNRCLSHFNFSDN